MGQYKRQLQARDEAASRPLLLGEAADRGLDILCWCNRCGHNDRIGGRHLAGRVGPDLPVPEIGALMRCSGCGGKDVATRPAPPSLAVVPAG